MKTRKAHRLSVEFNLKCEGKIDHTYAFGEEVTTVISVVC